ncbi:MAG: hypothetical protein AAGC68_08260, partial [Verrucomicrobiota bacterium]
MALFSRHLLRVCVAFTCIGSACVTSGQESVAKLGILLDTSAPMGFLVPQARKEVEILNKKLAEIGRPPIVMRELEGASIGKEASLSVPGSKNALYPIKDLFEKSEVDTVYWITSLEGLQSGSGIATIERILNETPEGKPKRQLVIRHIWQEQVEAGDTWLRNPPPPEHDRLDPKSRPGEWYRMIEGGRGLMIRSWHSPPAEFREQFGFPWRSRHSGFLRSAGYSAPVEFDFSWANGLRQRHGLHFMGPKEEWPIRITGRSWIFGNSLIPFLEDGQEEWNEAVLAAMSKRDSIEEDLSQIEARKLGVLFAFGYLQSDLARFQLGEERARRHSSYLYMKDVSRFVQEA